MNMEQFCGGWWWLCPIAAIVMLIVMITVFSFICGRGGCPLPWWGQQKPPAGSETALDILKKRYAKGEISQQEFERMKKEIQ